MEVKLSDILTYLIFGGCFHPFIYHLVGPMVFGRNFL